MRKVIFAITLIMISSISSIVIEDKSLVLINVSKEESTEKTNNSLNNSIKKSRLGGEPITNYSTSPDWNITLMTASTHSSTPDMSIGDIDNDGHNDLILCVNGGQNRIFSGDGNGTFTLTHQFSGNAKTIKSALLDIDKDGYLDIVFANQLASGSTGAKNVIHMNNNGTF